MRRLNIAIVALALTALSAAPAHAKGVTKLTACGASGCHDATPKEHDTTVLEAGAQVGPPDAGAPFYELRATVGPPPEEGVEGVRVQMLYVPSLHVIRVDWPEQPPQWMQTGGRTERALNRTIAGLTPFPASGLNLSGATPVTEARVVEVVPAPRPDQAASSGIDWLAWAAGGSAALLLLGGFWARLRRRRAGPGLHPAG